MLPAFLEKTGVVSLRTAPARQHVKSRSSRIMAGGGNSQALFQVLILRYDIHYNSHKYLVKMQGDIFQGLFTAAAVYRDRILSLFFLFPFPIAGDWQNFPNQKSIVI